MIGRQKDTLRQTIFGLDYQFLGAWINHWLSHWHWLRAIVRTLNSDYSIQTFGLGGANTKYPVSAFITDILYLKGTCIKVDTEEISASDILGFLIIRWTDTTIIEDGCAMPRDWRRPAIWCRLRSASHVQFAPVSTTRWYTYNIILGHTISFKIDT
jgi:hypothetical protein